MVRWTTSLINMAWPRPNSNNYAVNIDDCWAQMARVNGKMVADPKKFPSGINGVATKIHALGLKVGIYSDAGSQTCSGEKRRPIRLAYPFS